MPRRASAFARARRVPVAALAALLAPLALSCTGDPGTGSRAGTTRSAAASRTPAPTEGTTSPAASASAPAGTPSPATSTSGDVTGGLDLATDRLPTPTPLGTATPLPTEVPRKYGDSDGAPIDYGVATSRLAFAAAGRGYAILANDKLGEFPSVGPGGAFTYAAGVTGLVALSPDAAGGLWVVGATSRDLQRLTGAALAAGTRVALGFQPALLAADATRAWVAGTGGEGLAYTLSGGATASVAFAEKPAGLAADGGAVWAADASGSIRKYAPPASAPSAAIALGGDLGALASADGGGAWALVKAATPRLMHVAPGATRSVDLGAGEVAHAVASGGLGKAWALTDKALYLIETMPGDVLQARRYPRTETWVPGGLATDPDDRRKVFATDPAGKAVRRLYTGS